MSFSFQPSARPKRFLCRQRCGGFFAWHNPHVSMYLYTPSILHLSSSFLFSIHLSIVFVSIFLFRALPSRTAQTIEFCVRISIERSSVWLRCLRYFGLAAFVDELIYYDPIISELPARPFAVNVHFLLMSSQLGPLKNTMHIRFEFWRKL